MMARRAFAAMLVALSLVPSGAEARRVPLADIFIAGRDANGEPCTATRSWNDPVAPDSFDRAFGITCRGVAASRRQGAAYAFAGKPAAADPKLCGASLTQTLTGIGPVETRTCFDPALGTPVATVRFHRGRYSYFGSAVATALGPLEVTLRVMAGRAAPPANRDIAIAASIDAGKLPAAPVTASAASTAGSDRLDAAAALQAGIALNYRGLYIEASRLLNDAISRLPLSTPALTRAELSLEAGLADSNISQFDAADDHFARAAVLIKGATDLDRAAFLQSKSATYRGLDLINRRDWRAAITALSDTGQAQSPLTDPAILSDLNQPVSQGAAASLSAADSKQLSRLLVEAQRNWARSVAYLAVGDTKRSRAALEETLPYVAQLQRNVSPDAVAALKSRIQRQFGRVAARDGRIADAIDQFDCAIATLQGERPRSGKTCILEAPVSVRGARAETGVSAGPLIAETQLERASLLARAPNVPDAEVLKDYDVAVDSLIRSGAAGGIIQPSMEAYLDLLSRLEAKAPNADLEQRFFRAIQAVGEPAIARQVAQLQTIVTANGTLGAKARDRSEIERQIIRLRYEISAADPANAGLRANLEAERNKAEAALVTANAALAADPRFRAVDDQPTTVADVRAALRPQEYYLKVTRLRSRAYAMVIGPDRNFIYALSAPAADVDTIARRVRASIRNDSGRLPFFDVAASYALFRLISGPAEATLASAKAIVVDPSGPLENLPAGVLVTSLDSVRRYSATRSAHPNDYSGVAFLGAAAELSNALSPRSFLITRKLPASTAAQPFLGFGENAPARLAQVAPDARVSFGTGCDIGYAELAEVMNGNKPVSAHELKVASTALGYPAAPEVTRDDFTDVGMLQQSATGEYRKFQVIHFATHGVPETQAGQCTRIPPSLVTTLAPPGPPGSPQSDGLLSLPEVAQLDLDANLVVLSACETASGVSGVGGRLSGQDESAATLDGLVRAFITANARAVIATYWQVPSSRQTEDFIGNFYSAGRTETIGAALRDAQRSVIAHADYSHPYFWGAYFLVGDGSKSMLSGKVAAAAAASPAVAARTPGR